MLPKHWGQLILSCVVTGVACVLTTLIWTKTYRHHSLGPRELPEFIKQDREALLDEAKEAFLRTPKWGPADLATLANMSWGLDSLPAAMERKRSGPIAITAYIHGVDKEITSMLVFGLNPKRETKEVIVSCYGPNEKLLRMVFDLHRDTKSISLVDQIGLAVKLVPLQEILAIPSTDNSGEISVSCANPYQPRGEPAILLPQSVPLVVALRDRDGTISNFVPVILADKTNTRSTSRPTSAAAEALNKIQPAPATRKAVE